MLSSASKATKEKILEQFKQDANKYLEKKKYEKYKRIQEEQEYLLKQEAKYNEEQKIAKERRKRKEQQFNDYNLMLTKLNYQKPINGFNSYSCTARKRPYIKYNIEDLERGKSLQKREREIIMKRDIIGKFLTDEVNDDELYRDLKTEKQKSQQYYKEINDLQYLEYQKNNIDLYGTIDPLIIKRAKKKYLTENPYSFKIRNDFWKSNLVHNPIINPENDINYNKYIFKEDFCNYINNSNKNSKNNDNYNTNINNINKTYNLFRNDNTKINMGNTDNKNNNNNYSIEGYNYKRINLFKNNNNMNNFIDRGKKNTSFSGYDLNMKKKFFNISNDYTNAISNYNNDDFYSNNNYNTFRQNTPQRKVMRQAVSTNFLQ